MADNTVTVETTLEINGWFPRDAQQFPCKCGGTFAKVAVTDDERAKYNCGRSYTCCAAAYVCDRCKVRLVGTREAPEAW